MTALMTIYCSFDVAGRSWVKLKKYQKSLREQSSKTQSLSSATRGSGHGVVGVAGGVAGEEKVARSHIKKSKRMNPYKRSGGNPNRSWRHR